MMHIPAVYHLVDCHPPSFGQSPLLLVTSGSVSPAKSAPTGFPPNWAAVTGLESLQSQTPPREVSAQE